MRMSFRRWSAICLVIGAAGTAGCGEHSPIPQTVDEVSHRKPGGGTPAVYRGSHRREIRYLLDHAAAWRTSRDTRTDGGVPPSVPIGRGCIRDTYVAAAVQHAWAAESYYRLRHPGAARMAVAVRGELDRADALCAGAEREGPDRCETLDLWGCPAPV